MTHFHIPKTCLPAAAVALMSALALTAGCGQRPAEPTLTPSEQVLKQLDAFKTALLASDLDTVMSLLSENYEGPSDDETKDRIGKQETREMFERMFLDGGFSEMDLSEALIEIEEDVAFAFPISMILPDETVFSCEMVYKKEGETWMLEQMMPAEAVY